MLEKCPVQLPSLQQHRPLGTTDGVGAGGLTEGREVWPGGHSSQYLVAKGRNGALDKQGEVGTQRKQC